MFGILSSTCHTATRTGTTKDWREDPREGFQPATDRKSTSRATAPSRWGRMHSVLFGGRTE